MTEPLPILAPPTRAKLRTNKELPGLRKCERGAQNVYLIAWNSPFSSCKILQATQKRSKFKRETRQNEMLNEPMANHRLQEKCSPGKADPSMSTFHRRKTVCSETDCPIASKGQKSLPQGITKNPGITCHGEAVLNP